MRLVPRDSGFAGLASSLSLAIANYKPIPQLPTTSSSNSSGNTNGNKLMPVSSNAGSTQQTFQVQSQSQANSYFQSHPVAEWGEPSVLYVSNTSASTSGANKFTSTKTVGPGKCPVATSYTPVGGADALPAPTFAPFDAVQANVYRYRQQQSVNLGAWFVAEGWMQSNYMSCGTGSKQAEMDLLNGFGKTATGVESAKAYLEEHWDTWITEADFAKLAKIGINTVRIPIGYWSVGPYFCENSAFEPWKDSYTMSWRYVARAINWAAKYNIGVLIDLHGAYGSQNGQPHSGLSNGKIDFFTTANMDLTKNLLVWLANEISDVTNVVGIQLLNEPVNRASLWPWYYDTMDAMRNASSNAKTVPLYFHDAFNLNKGSAFVANRTDFVVQDYHSYFVYTKTDTSMTAKQHTSAISGGFATNMQKQSGIGRRNLIVGEWSCALAPQSLAKSKTKTADQTAFCQAQEHTYRNAAGGWAFWSYQMENCANNGGWCFQQAIKSYLPSSFDSWGLATVTASYFRAFNVTSRIYVPSLTDKIQAIQMPVSLANVQQVQPNQAYSADALSDDDTEEPETDADSDATYVNVNGFVGMVSKQDSISEQDGARIGMVNGARRGLGGSTARASDIVRRATTNAQLAAQAGYNDGFKSVRYFAGNADLSRLGFGTQYRADSYRSRVAQGLLKKGNLSDYKKQYAAGILAAEKLVAKTISSYKS